MTPKGLGTFLITGALALTAAMAAHQPKSTGPQSDADIAKSVRHEIRSYPYYSLWDDINFEVSNGQVTLTGAVTQPVKKSDIDHIVRSLAGVRSLEDDINVLPLSPNDNLIRQQVAAAIYRFPALNRYAAGVLPSIHIIVENGHVTLTGVVENQTDKDLAGIRASGASLSFGPIVNNLQVERPSSKKT